MQKGKKFKSYCKTLQFKILLFCTIFLLLYTGMFTFFYRHTIHSMTQDVMESYEELLDTYVERLSIQISDTDAALRNMANSFDVNLLAVKDIESDDYQITKWRVYSQFLEDYSTLSILDGIYLYDCRTDDFLRIPSQKMVFEEGARTFMDTPEYVPERWCLFPWKDTYLCVKQKVISDSLKLLAFFEMDEVAEGIKKSARENNLLWGISTLDGEKLYGSPMETDVQTGNPDNNTMVESTCTEIGVSIQFYVRDSSVWTQNRGFIFFSLLSMVLAVLVIGFIFLYLKKRFLKPMNSLIRGMQDFAAGKEQVKVDADRDVEYEIDFAIRMFNDMVYQVEQNRFLVYEERLEKQQVMLQNLQSQINPHFFANTLNIIHSLIAIGKNDIAQKCLLLLSSYYRYVTRVGEKEVKLEQEFSFLQDYLEIMKFRYSKKLEVEIVLDERLRFLKIPPMLVQPLAENCTKHGLDDQMKHFLLRVEAFVQENQAVINVRDSGRGFPEEYRGVFDKAHPIPMKEEVSEENHVGVGNIYQRLMMYYGEDASMTIDWNGTQTNVGIILRNWEKYL